MTKFKVGDRVKLTEIGGSVSPHWGYAEGDTAVVKDASNQESIKLSPDAARNGYYDIWVMADEIAIVDTTPPETIQHEGYNYIRGEPVVPEWVKDGAWVVHKLTGKIGKVSKAYMGSAYFKPLDKTFRVNFTNHLVADDFRPFTDEDWKWGMWAEYKGEKVFVMSSKDGGGVFASKPTDTLFFALFSEITPTTAP